MSSCHKRRDVILKKARGRQMTRAQARRVVYRPITWLCSPRLDSEMAIGRAGLRETEASRRRERDLTSRLPIEPDGPELNRSAHR